MGLGWASFGSVIAQSSTDSLFGKGINAELRNDTLFVGSGIIIYPGQQFVVGTGARVDGGYRTIISKYAAIVPTIWGHNSKYEYDIENVVDSKKGRQLLAELKPGQILTIGKIGKGGKKEYQYYSATLLSDGKELKYRCDILVALRLKELLLQ